MTKHTPGPWKNQHDLTRGRDPIGILSADGMEVVAEASSEANAQLIAAAPDLLEALKAVQRLDYFREHNGLADTVRAAIAKAEGE